jgi:transposase
MDDRLREQVALFYHQLVKDGVIERQKVSYSSVYRLLRRLELSGKKPRKEPERKRFAHEKVNELWQTDMSYGPYRGI